MVGPVLSACARAQQWQQAMALLKLTKSPGPIAFNSLVTRLHLRWAKDTSRRCLERIAPGKCLRKGWKLAAINSCTGAHGPHAIGIG